MKATIAVAAITALLITGGSVAADAATKHTRPPVGRWHLYIKNEGERGGSMRVTHAGHRVAKLTIRPQTGCGQLVTVTSPMVIKKHGPDGDNGRTAYHVGASRSTTEPVRVTQGKSKLTANLFINFDRNSESANAAVSLSLPNGCEFDVSFDRSIGKAR